MEKVSNILYTYLGFSFIYNANYCFCLCFNILCVRYWLFGEKVQNIVPDSSDTSPRVRGWFPRKCAVAWIDSDGIIDQHYLDEGNQKKIN